MTFDFIETSQTYPLGAAQLKVMTYHVPSVTGSSLTNRLVSFRFHISTQWRKTLRTRPRASLELLNKPSGQNYLDICA